MDALEEYCAGLISISVVSHGQISLVENLLDDLALQCPMVNFEVILTSNIPEDISLKEYKFPVRLLRNGNPKGFGCNHNQAFRYARGEFFCVLNPDIRFMQNPFDALVMILAEPSIGVCAPSVVDPRGEFEDSVRRFPNPLTIMGKAMGVKQVTHYEPSSHGNIQPDWVAGMFMLFRSEIYKRIQGFDERYFLYYEDVDICARLTLESMKVLVCPRVQVIHDAQRTSHRNLKYMRWHLSSMLRFFLSFKYWRLL